MLRWVLPCPRGCEEVLADEVRALDVEVTDVRPTAVHALGSLEAGYRLCLWSRVASRVLLELVSFEADDDDTLYRVLRDVAWWEHFEPTDTFAIGSSNAPKSPFPAHFWVQRAKDAIVDAFRDRTGARPTVDKREPSIRCHLHVGERRHGLSLDFSGEGQDIRLGVGGASQAYTLRATAWLRNGRAIRSVAALAEMGTVPDKFRMSVVRWYETAL